MDTITELKSMMLQLQRSALIDTQTLFQLMIDKGFCSIDEILSTRQNIEYNNADVQRIDNEIENLTGSRPVKVKPTINSELLSQLKDLLTELGSGGNSNG